MPKTIQPNSFSRPKIQRLNLTFRFSFENCRLAAFQREINKNKSQIKVSRSQANLNYELLSVVSCISDFTVQPVRHSKFCSRPAKMNFGHSPAVKLLNTGRHENRQSRLKRISQLSGSPLSPMNVSQSEPLRKRIKVEYENRFNEYHFSVNLYTIPPFGQVQLEEAQKAVEERLTGRRCDYVLVTN